ncbi:unnamed protein product [Phyllotreta striolata]|uniref:Chitin-binding type-2 domain-containing protein n=1 Tax=Phyllotreta striolata TaxID=444603 RepID=A0A9N9TXG4_PHYSR|nr:unnamed protein product [Phyllotreta striolata]
MKFYLAGIVLFIIFYAGVVRTYVLGAQDEICAIENQQIPHESECNLYYRCVYGKKIPKICPDGALFNPLIANCDDAYNVPCGNLKFNNDDVFDRSFSDYYNLGELTDGSYEVTTRQPGECPPKSDPFEPDPLLPHEEKCNAFYKCFEGKKALMKCPGIFQFNAKISACDWPMNVKCVDALVSLT